MRRFGNIRRLPSGRYQARVRPRGKPSVTAPHTFDSESDAQAWLRGMEQERDLSANFDALGIPRPNSSADHKAEHNG